MRLSTATSFLLGAVQALATPLNVERGTGPSFFVLAGDSTTAKQSAGGGGWGTGFLKLTSGVNYGHNGATTASFRSGGDWSQVLSQVTSHKNTNRVFVTIAFGHNDQKSLSLAAYKSNLIQFAADVKAAGGEPIFVTPLTRRYFSGTPPKITNGGNLADQRRITIEAAGASGAKVIDLNQASQDYCNSIGPDASYKFNLNPTDYTHLNDAGSVVFGKIVYDLMKGAGVPV